MAEGGHSLQRTVGRRLADGLAGWGAELGRALAAPRLRVRWLLLRLLGLTLLIASASLWTQVIALSGARGVVPFAEVLEGYARQFGPLERLWQAPTLCWLWDGDGMLHLLCAGGVLAGVLCVLNLAPRAALAVGAVAYLSLASVCAPWLNFQWDALLIESLVLGALLAPRGVRPGLGAQQPPARAVVFLLLFLVFRLHFESGVVKLTSGDAVWRGLRALEFHYETQPLPSFVSAWVHGLPGWLHRACCAVMFVIELGAPLLLLAPWRRVRLGAVAGLLLLQVVIAATGNFAYFNLLTLVLVLIGLDDRVVPGVRWGRADIGSTSTSTSTTPGWGLRARLLAAFTTLVVCIGVMQLAVACWPRGTPRAVRKVLRLAAPPMAINSYGLFRWMTTTRDEIIIEGSDDGLRWLPYQLPAKPGDLGRAPPLVAPHQPRLDWQLWFAALGECGDDGQNHWVPALLQRMLEHRRPVLALFARVPFPNRPPQYLRTLRYRYRFTTPAQRDVTGTWWRRELLGQFCPVVTLVNGRLVAVDLGGASSD